MWLQGQTLHGGTCLLKRGMASPCSGTLQPQFILFSDASGSWGCGACWSNQWFHLGWPVNLQILFIAVKELIPVITAAALFGHQWRGHLIQLSVDNMSVVHVLNSTYSRDPHLMHLICIVVFLAAHFDFWFQAQRIEGKYNNLADALSRNNVPLFKPHFSQTIDHSSEISASLMVTSVTGLLQIGSGYLETC